MSGCRGSCLARLSRAPPCARCFTSSEAEQERKRRALVRHSRCSSRPLPEPALSEAERVTERDWKEPAPPPVSFPLILNRALRALSHLADSFARSAFGFADVKKWGRN